MATCDRLCPAAMALPLLLLLELALYASCFICGIVTAALVTIVQVGGQPCFFSVCALSLGFLARCAFPLFLESFDLALNLL